jgi:hypothetical protein
MAAGVTPMGQGGLMSCGLALSTRWARMVVAAHPYNLTS